MTRKEKIILFLLSAINFTHILDFMIMMPLGNSLMTFFQIDTQRFSLIVSAYSYAAFASGIMAAFVVDKYDRKRVMLLGYIGFLIGTLGCAVAPSYQLLIFARIIAGLFGGLIGAQVLSIIADTFSYEKRGQAMGYMMAAFSIASIVGVPFSLYLSNLFSWHMPFFLVVGIGIILVPLVMRYLPKQRAHLKDQPEEHPGFFQVLQNIFSVPHQRIALLLSGLLMFGHFLIIPFINPYMEFNVGFHRDQIPLIYMVGGIVTLFSSPFFGRMADKFGKKKIYMICGALTLVPVFLITHMPQIAFYWVLIVTGFWFAVANGRSVSASAMISHMVDSRYRGSFMSFNASLQQLFIGTASFLAGLIVASDANHKVYYYNWVGYLSIAVLAFCLLLPGIIEKRMREETNSNDPVI